VPRRSVLIVAAIIILAFHAECSSALDFVPTESEWLVWPDYCRARYMESGAGRDSIFSTRVGDAEVHRWESSLGDGWYALHHFCAGLAKTDRAAREPDKTKRGSRYNDAIYEFTFYIARTPPTHPLYAEAQVRVCLAEDSNNAMAEGLSNCDAAIRAQPSNPVGYTGKATVYRRHKQFTEAREVLDLGDKETGGKSAEIQYFLGLAYLDLKDYDKALEHARSAYSLGYPLQGLRNRLKAAGYSL
jgi:tetratricopeptide (TPR) repeat protein